MKRKLQSTVLTGVAAGLIGPFIGAFIYFLYLRYATEIIDMRTGVHHTNFFAFLRESWESNALNLILSIGAIFNLLLFFIFLWAKWWRPAYGVIYATMGWVVLLGALTFLL